MAKSVPATDSLEQATPTEPSVPVSALADALTQALKANAPKQRITIANRVAHNPMNPTNRKRKLDKDYYQNFSKIDVDDLLDEEFDLLPQLREGNFIPDSKQGYLVEIINVKRGAHRGIHIRYNNGSIDTRMELMTRAGSDLVTILRKCIAEYASQKEERKRRRKAEEED